MKKYVIDRFILENGRKMAVLEEENGQTLSLPFEALPESSCEGDVLLEEAEGYAIDKRETLLRREKARKMLEEIAGKSSKRPI